MSRDRKEEREEMDFFRTKMESNLAKVQAENVSKEKRIQELTLQLQLKTNRLNDESKELFHTTEKYHQQVVTNQQQKGEMNFDLTRTLFTCDKSHSSTTSYTTFL